MNKKNELKSSIIAKLMAMAYGTTSVVPDDVVPDDTIDNDYYEDEYSINDDNTNRAYEEVERLRALADYLCRRLTYDDIAYMICDPELFRGGNLLSDEDWPYEEIERLRALTDYILTHNITYDDAVQMIFDPEFFDNEALEILVKKFFTLDKNVYGMILPAESITGENGSPFAVIVQVSQSGDNALYEIYTAVLHRDGARSKYNTALIYADDPEDAWLRAIYIISRLDALYDWAGLVDSWPYDEEE